MSRKINRLLINFIALSASCYFIYLIGIISNNLIKWRTPGSKSGPKNGEINLYEKYRLLLENLTVQEKLVPKQILWPTCVPPRLDSHNKQIVDIIESHFKQHAHVPDCINSKLPKFYVDHKYHLFIPSFPSVPWRSRHCCFQTFHRDEDSPDLKIILNETCYRMVYQNQPVYPSEEFMKITCKDIRTKKLFYTDLIHHVPVKFNVEYAMERLKKAVNRGERQYRMKVQIIGIDSVSNLNFMRYLPQTREYLKRILRAVEFEGHNIVGSGSYGNLMPLLTGLTPAELAQRCLPTPDSYFDDCPLIWKNFSSKGYRTSYAEDHVKYGIFSYNRKSAFKYQPTDYDLRTLALDAESIHVGHNVSPLNKGNCWGSRLSFEVLMDNVIKTAYTFIQHNQWYFQFTWATALAHSYEKMLQYGEQPLLDTLQHLQQNKLLNTTALFILSDHGNRLSPARSKTKQGFVEERMPALYIALPLWFRRNYKLAMENLRRNSQLMTTHFDVHETLKEFWDVRQLSDENIRKRIQDGSYANQRGISLFLPIPVNRTCASAGITEQHCLCLKNNAEMVWNDTIDKNNKTEDNSSGSKLPQLLAASVVSHINSKISSSPQCQLLTLRSVLSLRKVEAEGSANSPSSNDTTKYFIKLQTTPGNGTFEALVEARDKSFIGKHVERVDEHENQSYCEQDRSLKPFCYCVPIT